MTTYIPSVFSSDLDDCSVEECLQEACGFAFDAGMRIGELESLLDALY